MTKKTITRIALVLIPFLLSAQPFKISVENTPATFLKRDGKIFLLGNHRVIWDGRNNRGLTVPSGIYFYHLKAGTFNSTKKMVFVR